MEHLPPTALPALRRRYGPPAADHPGRGSPVTPPVPPPPAPAAAALKRALAAAPPAADGAPSKPFTAPPAAPPAAAPPAAAPPAAAPEPPPPAVGPVNARLLVRARTVFGEGLTAAPPDGARSALRCLHDGLWVGDVRFGAAVSAPTFQLGRTSEGSADVQWAPAWRALPLPEPSARGPVLVLEDIDEPATDPVFGTSAFADVVFRRRDREPQRAAVAARTAAVRAAADDRAVAVVFGVRAPRVADAHAVYVVGDCDALGRGDNARAIRLSDALAPVWTACVPIPLPDARRTIRYRYIVRDPTSGAVTAEEDATHELRLADCEWAYLAAAAPGTAPVVVAYVNAPFRYATRWRGAGVALPVFSIRTRTSCGVGEFNDLPRVVDFCVATGHQLLQLLPINDTTSFNDWRDSYPYSAVSCFALHPQYLNLESLGEMPQDLLAEYRRERERLNALPQIDYEEVMRIKLSIIRRMYALQKDTFFKTPAFVKWFNEQQHWLVPYALFRFFMEINGSAEYDRWGARASVTPEEMERLSMPDTFHFDYLGVAYYTQFHLHNQLSAASDYAAKHGVVFKGDLPIGVNRYCADTWLNPHLFRLNMQAGAPPDYFCEAGQNWGFPTYDWEAMSRDGFQWWRERLTHMAKYFHAYRIDHILGFFRIWEIPAGFRTGMSGRFHPVHAIAKSELAMRGLWDLERLTMPYVHDGLLQGAFGDEWWRVKERFFEPCYGRLRFKPEFDTEAKIEKALALPDDAPEHERAADTHTKSVLFGLLNNVCLLRDADDADKLHPRFMIDKTSSFHELQSAEWKNVLRELYQDYFYRRQDELWRESAMRKLPMMKAASHMLVCGEDLGFVPRCVPDVMQSTNILSLAVQRMPEGDIEFGLPAHYRYECVASTSSHDVSTLRGWWEEIDEAQRQRYWEGVLHRSGRAPHNCDPAVVEDVLAQHLASPAMWIISPIQDLLGMDGQLRRADPTEEQINDPANPTHYWRFRLHVDMDTILERAGLIAKIAELNRRHGRGQPY